ncbi:hypothetical protein BTH42_03255 [Burkholderia sp. SRS-W-2-2016]|nr:hypothetical protein BTH42_03255 [Burkholderia sp. SRS-W-2-2016]
MRRQFTVLRSQKQLSIACPAARCRTATWSAAHLEASVLDDGPDTKLEYDARHVDKQTYIESPQGQH